ncbi:tetratricopeptide repeat protein [Candidatus Roizmanbacteria bacterium]|nr:tetratricopeptide repeat protein [Candidatus Roizmanbacteria bacterium]
MANQNLERKQKFTQQVVVFVERFREVPAASWAITTGAITIFAALQAVAFPDLKGQAALLTLLGVVVLSVTAAGWYALRQPSQLQRILEARAHFNEGCIAFEDRRYEVSIQHLYQACVKDDNNYFYVSRYGRACLRLGRYEEAITVLTQAHDLSPTKEGKLAARRNRGVAAMVVNKWGLAHSDFTEYLETNKNSGVVYRMRALIYLATGDLLEAEGDALKAIKISPKLCATHATLSTVLAIAGDVVGARQELSHALTLNHEKAISLYALAQAHAALGEMDEAIRRLGSAVRADTRFSPRASLDPLFLILRRDDARFKRVTNTEGKMILGNIDEEES